MLDSMGVASVLPPVFNVLSEAGTNLMNYGMQKTQWTREDNAVQRRVRDLEKAGLNKVLAAGGQGSPTSLSTHFGAPQFDSGSLSDVFAAGTARAMKTKTEADASAAVAQAEATKAEARFKERMFSGMTPFADWKQDGGGLVNWELAKRVAEAQSAIEGARNARAQADANSRDFELTSKLGMLSNLGSQSGNINLGLLASKVIENLMKTGNGQGGR